MNLGIAFKIVGSILLLPIAYMLYVLFFGIFVSVIFWNFDIIVNNIFPWNMTDANYVFRGICLSFSIFAIMTIWIEEY